MSQQDEAPASSKETRFLKIRKNYLTFINSRRMIRTEADETKKMKLRQTCAKIKLNSELLLELATDLTSEEQDMLKNIQTKEI